VAKTDKRAAPQQEAVEPTIENHDIPEVPPEAAWYVIHSYSGYENKVKKNLEHRIESMDMQDKIFQVVVPTEEEIELKDGQRRVVERRVFPGYVLVQMIMDEQSWYVVRNTPNVTGFVGMGNKPTPLPDEEVKRIMRQLESEEPKIKVDFKVGQKVRIVEGAFAEFTGLVQELYPDKGRARVMVSFFNRDTPVDVDFLQLEKV
jgi:transcription termination/antitermination protein NusG